ncbi:hypothetical protein GCM10012278_23830 [Nonomuraea glycinis]|uniref:Uncharacterized protein n=1 Tax=Nonomuraea glycinis TaxID=2047744 RepID=A0A918A3C8_9ACTN|nr:hypothetical protein GCM10012278_23830 [Nonomuraea glycinis]
MGSHMPARRQSEARLTRSDVGLSLKLPPAAAVGHSREAGDAGSPKPHEANVPEPRALAYPSRKAG